MEANAEVKSETTVKGTPKTSSRDLESRENTQREYLETDSWLTIPQALEDTFKEQGFTLGWLRIYLKGEEDYKAVGQKINEGWEFVTADEVPEMTKGYGYSKAGDRFDNCIVRGDVALGKVPTHIFEARQGASVQRNREMNEAIDRRLMSMQDRRMPITNNSSSQTTVGGRPTKFADS
jgi:hypothetical protein|tara:strand:+ start:1056 stop:1589 length:534 start_codon:yes stop_codon:yes gene_type:complete